MIFKVIADAIGKFIGIFKRSDKKVEKPESESEPVETVEAEPEEVIETKDEEREEAEKLADMEKLRREKTLQKIRRKQEKDRRKFLK